MPMWAELSIICILAYFCGLGLAWFILRDHRETEEGKFHD